MTGDERPEVTLGSWNPPDQYDDPELKARGSKPWGEIKGPFEPGDIDRTGNQAQVFELVGGGYAKDIAVLQKYRGEFLTLRHPTRTGKVYVESVTASPRDEQDEVTEFRFHDGKMQDVTETWQIYTYRVVLVPVEGDDRP